MQLGVGAVDQTRMVRSDDAESTWLPTSASFDTRPCRDTSGFSTKVNHTLLYGMNASSQGLAVARTATVGVAKRSRAGGAVRVSA